MVFLQWVAISWWEIDGILEDEVLVVVFVVVLTRLDIVSDFGALVFLWKIGRSPFLLQKRFM
jgi:hypothetical protein